MTARPRVALALAAAAVAALGVGCSSGAPPEPRDAARSLADALARRDAVRVDALLSRDARTELGEGGAARVVADARAELLDLARAVTAPGASVALRVVVPHADGESTELVVESGGFRIAAGSALPSLARSPAAALAGLRTALVHRSAVELLSLLAARPRAAAEAELDALVRALSPGVVPEPEVRGDEAEVTLGSGHRVRLRREEGAWRVEDLD